MLEKGTFLASRRSKWLPTSTWYLLPFTSLSLSSSSITTSASSPSPPQVTSQLCLTPISRAAPIFADCACRYMHMCPPRTRIFLKVRAGKMRHKTRSLPLSPLL